MSKTSVITLFGLLVAAGLVFTGCEVDSLDQTIGVTPSAVTLKKGESAQFTASGGYEYTWSLPDSPKGSISSRTGATITYTCLYNPGASNTATETLTVTSTIPGDSTGGSSTNSTTASNASSGSAYITITGSAE